MNSFNEIELILESVLVMLVYSGSSRSSSYAASYSNTEMDADEEEKRERAPAGKIAMDPFTNFALGEEDVAARTQREERSRSDDAIVASQIFHLLVRE